jgi:peptidoglycan/xylan/chitin deacetylase (PgdA/CDA1 family)
LCRASLAQRFITERIALGAALDRETRTLHLLYHELSPVAQKYSYVTETNAFAEHLAVFALLRNAKLQPRITFDDGHVSNYEQAFPLLEAHGFSAHFFITAGWTGARDGYMGWQQLREIHRAGHTIGAHGWSHTLLTHCKPAELQKELVDTRKLLQDQLGADITTLSFPGGRFNRRVLQACAEAGYTKLYTSIPRSEPLPEGGLIGRLNIRQGFTVKWLQRLFTDNERTLGKLQRQERIKNGARKVLGDKVYAALWARLNRADAETV